MKALDQALERRGGIMFDTVGVGQAISGEFLSQPAAEEPAPEFGSTVEPSFQPYTADQPTYRESDPSRQGTDRFRRPGPMRPTAPPGANPPFPGGILRSRKTASVVRQTVHPHRGEAF